MPRPPVWPLGRSPGGRSRGDEPEPAPGAYTIVSFHAHPDDEALLTAGTLSKASAEGHRVVLVVATGGEHGMVADTVLGDDSLGARRAAELAASAEAIGCDRVVMLGFADSGMDGTLGGAASFCAADLDTPARRLAAILLEEHADVLTIYDPQGGYGHPDHVRVHEVGTLAARLASTPVVLEATIDRGAAAPRRRPARPFRRLLPGLDLPDFANAYTATSLITHRIDVRDHLDAKRAALAAHVTQGTAESGLRTIGFLLRLPPSALPARPRSRVVRRARPRRRSPSRHRPRRHPAQTRPRSTRADATGSSTVTVISSPWSHSTGAGTPTR